MFGQPDDQQAVSGATQPAQNPSMLDNVSTQDLQGQAPADPQAQPAADPQTQAFAQQHPLTPADPFAGQQSTTPPPDPAAQPVADPVAVPDPATQPMQDPMVSPSQPATAPVFQPEETAEQAPVNEEQPAAPAVEAAEPAEVVDHDKLAGMKQEAMSHLEPLVDHIDGTPEETFKTTMMMIQANDNHTLLDKALAAAKGITDDKARAEALLDIINEINYFSQSRQPQ